ncbi:beta-glucosidase [Cohaesibacter sp. ES.047]|uniref:beta-glucosidase n=1 Tax=Cohaesibacter sp. ES.047 TaxID=1798205 RepID=UPI000BB83F24|nr:glycoside hydrolase family 3 C-terminal domain-containing protein [Cohaesibacter sp. ES.047]SNY92189.1 beta-glucosidase [Cohaesibacter sp. ES.047]
MTQSNLDSLLDAMTLEEQVSLLSGASFWRTASIDRLGVPAIKVTDGPNGARGEDFSGGVRSAAYPVAIALAASWNPELVEEIGQDLARETRSKGARVLLAPTVNMHRNPLNGRNFECFSEDPLLASTMAVAYIKGVQSEGVAATIKHFIGNECEYERRTTSSQIDEKTLREIYFPPFEAAVKEAGVACVMTAYNALNGTHTSQNRWLIEQVLRKEWGFDGVVMSDWTATHSTVEALEAGLDLEMPGPAKHRGEKLVQAVRDGLIDPDLLRQAARSILALGARVGAKAEDEQTQERAEDRHHTRTLIRRAGAESAVLLKNNHLLPIAPKSDLRIAVIGPNAARATMFGGGSAQINAHYAVTPLDGIKDAFPLAKIDYALGCPGDRYVPLIKQPVEISFFQSTDLSGEPVLKQDGERSEFKWFGPVAPQVDHQAFSARLRCVYVPQETGDYEVGLMSAGTSRLSIDGAPVLEAWESWERGYSYFGHGCAERRTNVHLEAGRSYEIEVDYACGDGLTTTLKAIRFGLRAPSDFGSLDHAVTLARKADLVVLVAGLNDDWETEAEDRASLDLPAAQNDLIEAIAQENAKTLVVMQSGSPVTMPWADKVPAILQLWYPGQECGNALGDILSGRAEPAGRLPQSFPAVGEDLSPMTDRPKPHDDIVYSEKSHIGYRGFQARGTRPQFPFGHGLGYGKIELVRSEVLKSACTQQALVVVVTLTNHGDLEGSEVVQLYLRGKTERVSGLAAYSKVRLAPGETETISITVPRRAFQRWSARYEQWSIHDARFQLSIGTSSETLYFHHTIERDELSTDRQD